MAYEFHMRRRIEFVDTDMAGIVHFSNFFRYMEATEHAFLASLGHRLHEQDGTVMRGFARVRAECEYKSPLRYQDEVDIHLLVERRGTRSLTYRFWFSRSEARGAPCSLVPVARGSMTVVAVTRGPDDEDMRPAELPAALMTLIEEAPAELLQAENP